jgi:RNA polymerase sigma-70 factor (ECF subfamily)
VQTPSGERPAFADVYRDHFGYVMHVLRRMGIAEREREDVAQDVFVAVHRSLPKFDPARPLLPWLHGVAVWTAKNQRELARHHREVLMDDMTDRIEPALDPEAFTAAEQERELAITLMQKLDIEHRAVLSGHDFDGFSMADVAEGLGITRDVGYRRLHAARRELAAAVARLTQRDQRALGQADGFALGAIVAADRAIPDAPESARARGWERLQTVLARGPDALSVPSAAPRLLARLARQAIPFAAGAAVTAAGFLLPRPPLAPRPPGDLVREVVASTNAAAPAFSVSGPVVPAPIEADAPPPTISPVASAAPRILDEEALLLRAADEEALLLRARVALGRGQLEDAMRAVTLHARRYPRGQLATDREELRAVLLKRLQPAAPAGSAAPSASPPHRIFGTDQ